MSEMFMGATEYNPTLVAGTLNVTSVQSFRSMFENALSFDQDLSTWKMSSAEELDRMFYGASALNQDLCLWQYYLPSTASVNQMFFGTDCEDTDDPDLTMLPVTSLCVSSCTFDEKLTQSPAMAPAVVPIGECFQSNEELGDAVRAYVIDPSETSSVAMEYGYPIGLWCVVS